MNEQIESVVSEIISVLPVLKNKLMRPDRYKETSELSPSHFQIMFMLDDVGKLPMYEIARNLLIAKSNLTPLVKKLIKKDFIYRLKDEHDGRIIHLALTDTGRNFIERHKQRFINHLINKLSNLETNELDELRESLQSIKTIISKIED